MSDANLLAFRLRRVMDTFSILISKKQNGEFDMEPERPQLFGKP
jgi:hypothetical protein